MKNNWTKLFATQFFGVLNDNLLKSLICFISIYWSTPENKSLIIAAASATMVIPFILLSPLAGYLSQIYEKRKIVEVAKLLELPIMLIAIVGFLLNSLSLVLFSMLCMGIQSALYSPAKYGLIKDLAGEDSVSKRLGTMELLSFVGVLSGSLFAGYIADVSTLQLAIIGVLLFSFALFGWLSARKINVEVNIEGVMNTIKPERILNPITFIKKSFKTSKKYKGVNSSILGLASFWLIGSIIQMNLLVHCPETLGLSSSQTGLVTAFVAVGIGVGCWVSGLITKNRLEMGLVCFAGIGLSITTLLLSNAALNTPTFIALLMCSAFFGGLFKVPLNTWIQQRTASNDLGNTLAYSNIVVFLFILFSAVAFALLQFYFNTYDIFKFTAIVGGLTTIIAFAKIPVAAFKLVLLLLSKIIYRVKVDGGNNFPINTGGIVIANHVSLLDVLILVATSPRNIRYVMHEDVYNAPFLGFFFKRLNMIPIGSTNSKQNLIDFTNRCKEEIEQGHLICLFPEGQLSRNGHLQGFKKGIENLAKEIEAPIIPMHMDNLTGTPLSFKTGTSKKYGFNFKTLGKKIHVTVGKPILKKITAFELREKVKDLEVINFSKRTKNLSTKAAIYEAKKQVFKSSDAFKNTASLEVENLIINTPNYEVKDLSGKKVILKGTKENTIGRPIPGVNVKIITNEDQLGVIYISHAFSSVLEWMNTGLIGHIDNDGFVAVINN